MQHNIFWSLKHHIFSGSYQNISLLVCKKKTLHVQIYKHGINTAGGILENNFQMNHSKYCFGKLVSVMPVAVLFRTHYGVGSVVLHEPCRLQCFCSFKSKCISSDAKSLKSFI